MRAGSSAQHGFTYLMLLVVIALAGTAAAVIGPVWTTELRRAKEAELMRIGRAFEQAIASYYEASPGTVKQLPARLDDLVLDNRFATIRRHLRKIYTDPITGEADWTVLTAGDGRVIGVSSRSERISLSAGPAANGAQLGPRRYSEWKFVYAPTTPQR